MRTVSRSVCAVIVTFEPDPVRLQEALARVRDQVDALVVVVNGSSDFAHGHPTVDVMLLTQAGNVGLAEAQNRGIAWAREHGHSHVLLLDQDSWTEPRMVVSLLKAVEELSPDHRLAAVGPRHLDPRVGSFSPFIRVRFPMSRKLHCESGTVRCDFLISSGMLISMPVLEEIGVMDSGLFIDNVDLDWCFRARDGGFELFGVGDARMEHPIGDKRSAVLGGVARVAHHPPVRLYFIMRNRLALYRRSHTPWTWVAQDMPRVLLKFFTFGVLLGPRRDNLRYMLRGLRDGVRGRSGPGPLAELPWKVTHE